MRTVLLITLYALCFALPTLTFAEEATDQLSEDIQLDDFTNDPDSDTDAAEQEEPAAEEAAQEAPAEEAPVQEEVTQQEEKAPEQVEETVADEPEPKVVLENEKPTIWKPKEHMFGTYRIRIGGMKPEFDDDVKLYQELYGNPKSHPSFSVDWFAWDWYVTFGLGFRTGYYSADGKTMAPQTTLDADNVSLNDEAPTSLTLIPLQVVATMEFTPFKGKWLVIDAWFGYEHLYFQEIRTTEDDTTAKTTTPTTTSSFSLLEDSDDNDPLTNKGWSDGTVLGFSANFLLNPLDETSVRSMRNSMGLGAVYLSPFMEVVTALKPEGLSFGRSSMGIGFTFETVR